MIYLVSNQLSIYDETLYTIVSIENAIDILKNEEELCLDTETTGLSCFTDKLLLVQLGNFDFQVEFDIQSFGGVIPKKLADFMNNYKGLYVLQNAKFDLKFLFVQNVILTKVYDTMLAETILTNGLQFGGRGLANLAEKYCNETLDKSEVHNIINKGLSDNALVYGARDIKFLPEIKRKQLKEAEFFQLSVAIDLDNSFVVVLAYTEFCGIKLDLEKWLKKTNDNIKIASEIQLVLETMLWEDGLFEYFSGMADLWSGKQDCILNWDSPKQVTSLFKHYGINTTIKEKGVSKESIDSKVLDPQKKDFKILPPYLEYKAVKKIISTYGAGWEKYINPSTGRIHTTFKQLMDTSRLSCGNKRDGTPNLQNLPGDKLTRSCFIPEVGNIMIDADYSSQEQIILANFSKEDNLINFYAKGFSDMHSYVAFLMYENIRRCSVEELTPEGLNYIPKEYPDQRKLAKNAGFAIIPLKENYSF